MGPARHPGTAWQQSLSLLQVCTCYPKDTAGFPKEVMGLLDQHHMVLEPQLRRTLVQALILMRNRGFIESLEVLPLFFRLFK